MATRTRPGQALAAGALMLCSLDCSSSHPDRAQLDGGVSGAGGGGGAAAVSVSNTGGTVASTGATGGTHPASTGGA